MIRAGVRTVRRWLIAGARGEVSAAGLDGLRDVGSSAYALAEEAEQLRLGAGWDPWRADRATQLFLVCVWNAFALQTTADHLLESDGLATAGESERVPEATLAFAQSCVTQVSAWVRAARFAEANTAYRVSTPLPATFPSWPQFEPARAAHLHALRSAYEAVAPRAEYDLGRLVQTATPERKSELAELSLVSTDMRTALEFAGGLELHARGHAQLREVCNELARALSCAYTLGQLVAMPSLVERIRLAGYRANPSTSVPLTAISIGCPVVDRNDDIIGRVADVEGETALGSVTGLVISVGAFSANLRVRIEQLRAVEPGVVRLSATKAELERV